MPRIFPQPGGPDEPEREALDFVSSAPSRRARASAQIHAHAHERWRILDRVGPPRSVGRRAEPIVSVHVGDVIDGRYKVLEKLGEGGHGVVLKAVDETLGSLVAIKFLHESVASEPGFKTRLMREARAMGALSGTSAVQVFSFGKTKKGGMYIVMEFVAGRTLEQYLREIEAHQGRLAVSRLLELIGPIVDTLEAAHQQLIVHRDLKPGNIMVPDSLARGPVRLLDFGLAKDLTAEPLTIDRKSVV